MPPLRLHRDPGSNGQQQLSWDTLVTVLEAVLDQSIAQFQPKPLSLTNSRKCLFTC